MESKEPVHLNNCEIKKDGGGKSNEIILRSTTSINKSLKKFDLDKFDFNYDITTLDSLQSKNKYDKVNVKVKVIEISDPSTTSYGKEIQEVIVSDGTVSSVKCTLWEKFVGTLQVGKNYHLCQFSVQEFNRQKSLYTPREGAEIKPIEDFPLDTDDDIADEDEEITDCCIVGVPKLDNYKECLQCNARVEPPSNQQNLVRCSKADCNMLQRYDVCQQCVSAKLMFKTSKKTISLFASNKLLLDMAGVTNDAEITEETLLTLAPFSMIKYKNNIITSFIK